MVGDVSGRYALHHSGTGRRLIHQLKYHGVVGAADVLAALMVPLLPESAMALTPIPRALVRRIAFGVDPAWELTKRMARLAGLPVARVIRPALWWPRHSSRPAEERREPVFRAGKPPGVIVLIDDVVTSGLTVRGALRALATPPGTIASVISATSPGMMNPLKAPTASRRMRDV